MFPTSRLFPHTLYIPCPSHRPWLIAQIIPGEEYKPRSSPFRSFLQSPLIPPSCTQVSPQHIALKHPQSMWNLRSQVFWVALLNRAVINCRPSFDTPRNNPTTARLPPSDNSPVFHSCCVHAGYCLAAGCTAGHYKKTHFGYRQRRSRYRPCQGLICPPGCQIRTYCWFILRTVLIVGSFNGTVLTVGSFNGTVLTVGSFNGTVLTAGSFNGTVLLTKYHSCYYITVSDLGEACVTRDGQEEGIQYFGEETARTAWKT